MVIKQVLAHLVSRLQYSNGCLVKQAVRCGIIFTLSLKRNARAGVQAQRLLLPDNALRTKEVGQFTCKRTHPGLRNTGAQEREFITGQAVQFGRTPKGVRVGANKRAYLLAHGQKHGIATLIAKQTVYFLEAVQVQKDEAGVLPVFQISQQAHTIGQPGQGVRVGGLQFTHELYDPIKQVKTQRQQNRACDQQYPVVGVAHGYQHPVNLILWNAGTIDHTGRRRGVIQLIEPPADLKLPCAQTFFRGLAITCH